MPPATSAKAQIPAPTTEPPCDGLNLPLPPTTLDFAIRGDGKTEGYFQRYVRKGDASDASSAVIGKGGFGTAYRFNRDDSFTPPNSLMDATINSADHELSGGSEAFVSKNRRSGNKNDSHQSNDQSLSSHAHHLRSSQHLRSPHSLPSSPKVSGASMGRVVNSTSRNRAPAVVVVKVCRTPTSGSYDELPKTGVGRTEARVAAQEIAAGNPIGEHTRIVRGEARLLRYLQMRRTVEGIKSSRSHVVRLLADVPMPKYGIANADGTVSEQDDENYSGPPVPRLLVFERLVDLDAEFSSNGWHKSKHVWTIEKVETVSKDALAGLAFLHAHAIVHGDLKPSNFMRDAKTGAVKLIDLGASRRWVRLHNMAKERTTAVEELDRAVQEGQVPLRKSNEILCEGLGSLTGSPHFMAPEVLLQAGRYLAADGMAHNVLDDYMTNKHRLPQHPSVSLLHGAHHDFKRGWGIKADIWSWGCSILSLLLRTIESAKRPSSNTVCAFDFSFESDADALQPMWPLHGSNETLPRFHQWARLYALRIASVVENGVELPDYIAPLSTPFVRMLQASFQHQDSRPSAAKILEYLDSHTANNVEYMTEAESRDVGRSPSRAHSIAPSCTSVSSVGPSMPDDPHNIDLSISTSTATQKSSAYNMEPRMNRSEQNLAVPVAAHGTARHVAPHAMGNSQRDAREAHMPLSSPALGNLHITSTVTSQSNSPMPSSGHAQRLSLHQGPSSVGIDKGPHHSPKSSPASEHNLQPSVGERAPGSPNMTVYTAICTPATDVKHVYGRMTQGKRHGAEEARPPFPQSTAPTQLHTSASTSTLETAASDMPLKRSSIHQNRSGKSRRGSIFARMASSLAPKLHSRESASTMNQMYDSGERYTRGSTNTQLHARDKDGRSPGAVPSSPSIEYLHDSNGAVTRSGKDVRAESRTGDNDNRASGDVEMNDRTQSLSGRNRKSAAYNVLGLEFGGGSRQSPMRSVRSFASLRNFSASSAASHNEVRSPAPHQFGASRLHEPTSCQLRSGGQPQNVLQHRRLSSEHHDGASLAAPHVRCASSAGTSIKMSLHPDDESALPHITTAGTVGHTPPTFLQTDPYSRRPLLSAPADTTTHPSGAAHPVSRRQRSWSSFFKRNKQPT